MSNCEHYAELISAMIDGEISENEKAEIEAHTSQCAECRKMLEAFAAVSESLEELEDLPSGLHDGIMKKVKTADKRKKPAWTKILPLAACLTVVIFGGVKLMNTPDAKDNTMETADMYSVRTENSDAGDGEYADIIFAASSINAAKNDLVDSAVLDSEENEAAAENVMIVPAQLRQLLMPAENLQRGETKNSEMTLYCTVIFHDGNGDEEVQVFIDGDEAYADFGDGPVLVSGTAQEIIDMIG
ncbi:MAG: zf-HC2 domain-containing protein [Bacillota bacterium]|nr:zf-HC2 domain-containing protein [Bacillota bacterium]